MRLPNLLATRRGRLLAFFALYMAEGIPAGFTGTAVATQDAVVRAGWYYEVQHDRFDNRTPFAGLTLTAASYF